MIIARWESRGGKHWVELEQTEFGFSYRGNGCGGVMAAKKEYDALQELMVKVNSGYFLPDSAKTPMRRVR